MKNASKFRFFFFSLKRETTVPLTVCHAIFLSASIAKSQENADKSEAWRVIYFHLPRVLFLYYDQ